MQEITKKYHHAAETFQNVDPDASTTNTHLLASLIENVASFKNKLRYVMSLYNPGDQLASLAQSVNMLTNGSNWYADDFTQFRRSIQNLIGAGTHPINHPPVWEVIDNTRSVQKYFFEGYINNVNKTQLYKNICLTYNNKINLISDDIGGKFNFDPDKSTFADAMHREVKDELLKKYNEYSEKLTDMFGNDSTIVMANHVQDAQCTRLTTSLNLTLSLYPNAQVDAKCMQNKDFTQLQDINEMNAILDPFFTQVRSSLSQDDWNLMLNIPEMDDTCDWFRLTFQKIKLQLESVSLWALCQKYDVIAMNEYFNETKAAINSMINLLEIDLAEFVNNTKSYAEKKITKLQKEAEFFRISSRTALRSL